MSTVASGRGMLDRTCRKAATQLILRRSASAIRRKDWFAVLTEFVIVVAGIVVAIQLDNWNEARLEAERAASIARDSRQTCAATSSQWNAVVTISTMC